MRKVPLKLGVRLDPPAIIYIYRESGSLRMRSMPLRNFWANTDVEFVIEDFRNHHGDHIEDIPDYALRKMMNIIKKSKQGKSLDQILDELNNKGKKEKEDNQNERVFGKLISNVRGNSLLNSPKKTMDDRSEEESKGSDSMKKREFPKKITFATSLFENDKEQGKIHFNETNKKPLSDFSLKSSRNNDLVPEKDFNEDKPKRPNALNLSSFELTTSFNKPLERKNQSFKDSFFRDLEKDLIEIENSSKSKKENQPEKQTLRKGFGLAKEKEEKLSSSIRSDRESKSKNADDTDVEFDDSDNPLDDPEEDFW